MPRSISRNRRSLACRRRRASGLASPARVNAECLRDCLLILLRGSSGRTIDLLVVPKVGATASAFASSAAHGNAGIAPMGNAPPRAGPFPQFSSLADRSPSKQRHSRSRSRTWDTRQTGACPSAVRYLDRVGTSKPGAVARPSAAAAAGPAATSSRMRRISGRSGFPAETLAARRIGKIDIRRVGSDATRRGLEWRLDVPLPLVASAARRSLVGHCGALAVWPLPRTSMACCADRSRARKNELVRPSAPPSRRAALPRQRSPARFRASRAATAGRFCARAPANSPPTLPGAAGPAYCATTGTGWAWGGD